MRICVYVYVRAPEKRNGRRISMQKQESPVYQKLPMAKTCDTCVCMCVCIYVYIHIYIYIYTYTYADISIDREI